MCTQKNLKTLINRCFKKKQQQQTIDFIAYQANRNVKTLIFILNLHVHTIAGITHVNQNREVFIYQYYMISMAKQGIRWSVLSDFKIVDKCSQK